MNKMKQKRAQITIFIVLAILIVAVVIIIFLPNIKKLVLPPSAPDLISNDCLKADVPKILNQSMIHGGTLKPELYFMYNNESLDYLCYTGEWYKTCVMQKPLLKEAMENEINTAIQQNVQNCVAEAEARLKSRGYEVKTTGTGKASVEFVPKKVMINLDIDMILTKNEVTQTYSSSNFRTQINSEVYDMIMVASSIQNFEARYGDSTPESYMGLYPNIKVQKLKQSDGTKVYIITSRTTGEKLQFATRSLAWPPGYAVQA